MPLGPRGGGFRVRMSKAIAKVIRADKLFKICLDLPPGLPTYPDGTFCPLPNWPGGERKHDSWPVRIHPPREHSLRSEENPS